MSITQDATSKLYIPANCMEWMELLAGGSLVNSTVQSWPIAIWNFQDASGTLSEAMQVLASSNAGLAATGSPLYAQSVTGFSRKAAKLTAGTDQFQGTIAEGTTGAASVLAIVVPDGAGYLITIGDPAEDFISVQHDGTTFIIQSALTIGTGVGSYATGTPWILFMVNNNSAGRHDLYVYSKTGVFQELIQATHVNTTGTSDNLTFGKAGSSASALSRTLYAAYWTGNGTSPSIVPTTAQVDEIIQRMAKGPLGMEPWPRLNSIGARATGTGTTTATATVVWPSHLQGMFGVMICAVNATTSPVVTTPSGWVTLGSSPQSNTSTALYIFTKFATSNAEPNVTLGATGSASTKLGAFVIVFDGVVQVDVTAGNTGAASGSVTIPTATTTNPFDTVVDVCEAAISASTGELASWSNSTMFGFGEIADLFSTTSGNGTGVSCGIKKTAGSVGTTTSFLGSSVVQGRIKFALSRGKVVDRERNDGDWINPLIDAAEQDWPPHYRANDDMPPQPVGLDDGGAFMGPLLPQDLGVEAMYQDEYEPQLALDESVLSPMPPPPQNVTQAPTQTDEICKIQTVEDQQISPALLPDPWPFVVTPQRDDGISLLLIDDTDREPQIFMDTATVVPLTTQDEARPPRPLEEATQQAWPFLTETYGRPVPQHDVTSPVLDDQGTQTRPAPVTHDVQPRYFDLGLGGVLDHLDRYLRPALGEPTLRPPRWNDLDNIQYPRAMGIPANYVALLVGNEVAESELAGETPTSELGGTPYTATICAQYQTTTRLDG